MPNQPLSVLHVAALALVKGGAGDDPVGAAIPAEVWADLEGRGLLGPAADEGPDELELVVTAEGDARLSAELEQRAPRALDPGPGALVLDADEQEAMSHLLDFLTIVSERWGLTTNTAEFSSAIARLERFVIAHMLYRVAPAAWASWYSTQAPATEAEEAGP